AGRRRVGELAFRRGIEGDERQQLQSGRRILVVVADQAEQRVELLVVARLEQRDGGDADVDGRQVHLRRQVLQELEHLDVDAEALLDLLREVLLDRQLDLGDAGLDRQEEGLDRLDNWRHHASKK